MSFPEAVTWKPAFVGVVRPTSPTLPMSCDCQAADGAPDPPDPWPELPPVHPQPESTTTSAKREKLGCSRMVASSGGSPHPDRRPGDPAAMPFLDRPSSIGVKDAESSGGR